LLKFLRFVVLPFSGGFARFGWRALRRCVRRGACAAPPPVSIQNTVGRRFTKKSEPILLSPSHKIANCRPACGRGFKVAASGPACVFCAGSNLSQNAKISTSNKWPTRLEPVRIESYLTSGPLKNSIRQKLVPQKF